MTIPDAPGLADERALGRILAHMGFDVSADAYDRFMGRYSAPLAPQMADLAGVVGGQRVLDVGCGPGALTAEMVVRVGESAVSAVDPSESFVAATRRRHPGVDVQHAVAEHLPFADEMFDVVAAQLVVHFMSDPVAGLGEMQRVARAGGVVVACVWDHADGGGPLSLLWEAAHSLDPDVEGESALPGAREGDLAHLFVKAGLSDVHEMVVSVRVEHPTFEEWWDPFTLGVGPAGEYVRSLAPEARERLRERCRDLIPASPFVVIGRAWAARATASV
jgi:SAM-dependent methyltransferase